MIRCEIPLIDDVVGGIRPGSSYVLTGGAGSGKTTCALRFADTGLRQGVRVAMLVHSPPGELFEHAHQVGVDLKAALRDGRLLLLRYRSDFPRRLAHYGSGHDVIDDLRRQVLAQQPDRLVIDSFAPLLEDGSASAVPASQLAELLELSQSAALLTYPSELGTSYDRRLEPLVHAATAIMRLVRTSGGGRRIEVVSLRAASHGDPSPLAAARPLLLLQITDSPSDDLLAALRFQHEVIVRSAGEGYGDAELDGLIIEADHRSLETVRAVIRAWQTGGRAQPIIVATRFTLRSLDRARLLRDGADEVLAGDMGMPELLQRLAAALDRGPLGRPPLAVHEDETLTHRTLALPGELLDRDRFVQALRARTAHDDAVPFTLLRLTTESEDPEELRALGALVLGGMRVNSGDLAALMDDAIAVYLHGAGRRDIAPFLERLRGRCPPDASALRVASACYPVESDAVRELVAPLEVR